MDSGGDTSLGLADRVEEGRIALYQFGKAFEGQ